MKSFHSDAKVKEFYLARVRAHKQADQLIKGKYWENGKGCAVGCTIHSSDHGAYEIELGIPRILARLEDALFEGLPNELAMTWPERFLEAIPVGVDLDNIWYQFALWLLVDPTHGVIQYVKTDQSRVNVQVVADLYQRHLTGEKIDYQVWKDAADAADAAAAAYAAYAAYAAAAAADAAAAAAAYAAAAYAADAYAAAAYAAAAAAAAKITQSEKLLQLLRDAK